jgi:hypothetical protein
LPTHWGQSKAFCRTIYLAALLHDTGKIGISDAVLNKPAALTDDERLEIQRHIEIGAQILKDGDSDLIRMAYDIALYHHEKWAAAMERDFPERIFRCLPGLRQLQMFVMHFVPNGPIRKLGLSINPTPKSCASQGVTLIRAACSPLLRA